MLVYEVGCHENDIIKLTMLYLKIPLEDAIYNYLSFKITSVNIHDRFSDIFVHPLLVICDGGFQTGHIYSETTSRIQNNGDNVYNNVPKETELGYKTVLWAESRDFVQQTLFQCVVLKY